MTTFLTSLTEAQTPLVIWEGYEKVQQGYLPSRTKEETQNKTVPLDLILRVWIDEQRKVYSAADQEPRTVRMFPWYRVFLEQAVLPNVGLYAILVTVGELTLGAVLLLGQGQVLDGLGIAFGDGGLDPRRDDMDVLTNDVHGLCLLMQDSSQGK